MSEVFDAEPLIRQFNTYAGGHLQNTIAIPGITCMRCRGTVVRRGRRVCHRCAQYGPGTADQVGSLIYAVKGVESGHLMHRYKQDQQVGDLLMVLLVLFYGLQHQRCVDELIGIPSGQWTMVPSLKRSDRVHPLREMLGGGSVLPGNEIAVAASDLARDAPTAERRELNPDFYDIGTPVLRGGHVLVIDDTWVSGGHAQSVAAALKQAGAGRVSILAIARWLDARDPHTRWVYNNQIRHRPYDAASCPWTGGCCLSHRTSTQKHRVAQPPLRCSLHNTELGATGECDECAALLTSREGSVATPKPWWQFWR